MIRNVAEYPVEVILNKIGDNLEDLIPEYQRLYVWKKDRQSKFIRHILSGYPTHKVFIDDRHDSWKILDGQQRIITINNFISNSFTLDANGKSEESQLWNGKKFKDLSKQEQRIIMRYTLTCEIITNAENQEIEGLFDGLNSGMPLGKITEILLKDIEIKAVLNKVKDFPFINKIINNMSESEINKQEDDLLVLRILALFCKNQLIHLDGDTLENILIEKIITKDLDTLLKRIKSICESIDTLYDSEIFGSRKIIAPHSIPIFMWYKTKHSNTEKFKRFCEALIAEDKPFRNKFKTMNKSNTASRTTQQSRLDLFDEIFDTL